MATGTTWKVNLRLDSEQFMMIEDLYKTTDKLNKHVEDMALKQNVNIHDFLIENKWNKVLTDL